ncbi:hypothetical protein [Oceanobacillus neutriphilus]|uniref:Alpha-ribazole kinase n=1 Tax=Oceanobacillus neutriphilus TaxID=531815 RepID=A0ABQ2P0L0_9BACI|nr:hypothetical protein [Oceanobacillus neutriphilus]GGP15240.1 hypothetical protein GCM10011346_42460 [Oceanobacillus neutriphilus]
MTNAIILPLEADKELVIATDNSGAIGEKESDLVKTSNQIVGKFACRVVLMECLAEYAEPVAVIMQNFTNEEAWQGYESGVREELAAAGIAGLPITGSTESNFQTFQSGLGLTLIGKREKRNSYQWTGGESFAVIGAPFTGQAVLENNRQIPSAGLLKKMADITGVNSITPVGSKGIARTFQQWTGKGAELQSELDLQASAGPATCFLIAFEQESTAEAEQLAGRLFHLLKVSNY